MSTLLCEPSSPTASPAKSGSPTRDLTKSDSPQESSKLDSPQDLTKLIAPPGTKFSLADLQNVSQMFSIDEQVAWSEISKVCVESQRIVADVFAAGHSLKNALDRKFTDIKGLFDTPLKGDWKISRKPLADQHPFILLDGLLDLYGLVVSTGSLWRFTETQATQLAHCMDRLSVDVCECQRRLIRQSKTKTGKYATEVAETKNSPQLVDALGIVCSKLSAIVRAHLDVACKCQTFPVQPLIEELCCRAADCSKTTDSETSSSESVLAFITTTAALESSQICKQLLGSREMASVVTAMQALRSALKEYSRQRAFEWRSFQAQATLPHHHQDIPAEMHSRAFADAKFNRTSEFLEESSEAISQIRSFLQSRLMALASGMAGLYRAAGALLGGCYEDPDVQRELVTASVLGTYVSMVGFIFLPDLQALARWLDPMLPSVRRLIKQQSAPVNINDANDECRNSTGEDTPSISAPVAATTVVKSTPAAASLYQLLSNPTELVLSRSADSLATLNFFIPAVKKGGKVPPPADRVNRVLVWLAWEGDLLSLFREARTESPALENAIMTVVVNGLQTVVERLSTAESSLVPNNVVWSGKGEDAMDFFQRVLEAISLRHLGEFECRLSSREGKLPPWKACLLSHLARLTMPLKAQQTSSKLVESLPKLFGEFSHQTAFYSCPIPSLVRELPEADGVSVAVGESSALASRLGGMASDFDQRIVGAELLGELSVLNCHSNKQALEGLDSRLNLLQSQFSSQAEGVVDRHSNQIKAHTNRLEEHAKELQSFKMTHQTYQKQLQTTSSEMKRLVDAVNDLQKEIEFARPGVKAGLDCRNFPQLLEISNASITQNLEEAKAQLNNLKSEYGNLKTLYEELAKRESVSEQLEALTNETSIMKNKITGITESLHHEIADMKGIVDKIQQASKHQARYLVESVVQRTKRELSDYIKSSLSQCISSHVIYHLEQEQSQRSSKRRFLPSLNWSKPTTDLKLEVPTSPSSKSQITPPNLSARLKPPPSLIRSTHKPSEDFDGTASVMDEGSVFEPNLDESWYIGPEVNFLDLPECGAATPVSSPQCLEPEHTPGTRKMTTKSIGLLKPTKSLQQNWEIDVAAEVDNYLNQLDQNTNDLASSSSGGLNFIEAALLLQGGTSVYGRKVEYLRALTYRTLTQFSHAGGHSNTETKALTTSRKNLIRACDDWDVSEAFFVPWHAVCPGKDIDSTASHEDFLTVQNEVPQSETKMSQRTNMQLLQRLPSILIPRDDRSESRTTSTFLDEATGTLLLDAQDAVDFSSQLNSNTSQPAPAAGIPSNSSSFTPKGHTDTSTVPADDSSLEDRNFQQSLSLDVSTETAFPPSSHKSPEVNSIVTMSHAASSFVTTPGNPLAIGSSMLDEGSAGNARQTKSRFQQCLLQPLDCHKPLGRDRPLKIGVSTKAPDEKIYLTSVSSLNHEKLHVLGLLRSKGLYRSRLQMFTVKETDSETNNGPGKLKESFSRIPGFNDLRFPFCPLTERLGPTWISLEAPFAAMQRNRLSARTASSQSAVSPDIPQEETTGYEYENGITEMNIDTNAEAIASVDEHDSEPNGAEEAVDYESVLLATQYQHTNIAPQEEGRESLKDTLSNEISQLQLQQRMAKWRSQVDAWLLSLNDQKPFDVSSYTNTMIDRVSAKPTTFSTAIGGNSRSLDKITDDSKLLQKKKRKQ